MRSQPISKQTRFTPPVQRMLGYGVLLLLSLAAALAMVLWHDRTVRYRHGQAQVNAIVSGAARELSSELEYLERGLTGLALDARQFSSAVPEQLPHLLAMRIAGIEQRNPDLRDIHLGTSLPDMPGLQGKGSGAAEMGGRMRIGHPRKHDEHGWVLPLALPIAGAAPGEAVWIVAFLKITSLERIADGLNLGGDGVANIVHGDGWIVVRSREQARWVGKSLRDSELFRDELPRAANGTYELTSVLDGSKRIAAYRTLARYHW